MKYRSFGRLGWQISEIGFGAWAIGGSGWGEQKEEDSVKALHAALDQGCNFIDTAQGYGNGRSEEIIGKVLRERKEEVYVATKVPPVAGTWPPSPYDQVDGRYPEEHLRKSVEGSLKRLQTDCLDVLQLHTWTRAWNARPEALEILGRLKREGKIRGVGISTPEQDQNSVIGPMRAGLVDSIQVIYNIFEQEPAAELLPAALEHGVAIIVRVAFDEGSLTGKFTGATRFPEGDMRAHYFEGDRLERTVARVEAIRETLGEAEPDMAAAALKFALKPQAVSTVIPGMRNAGQAVRNCQVSGLPPLADSLERELRKHAWRRGFWYAGK